MKRLTVFTVVFLLGMVFIPAFCFGEDPAEGFWLSVDEKTGKATGGWELYVVGDMLLGKVLSLADLPQDKIASQCKESYRGFPLPGKVNEMPVVGTPWIFGLTRNKEPGSWKDGHVIDAGTGSMWKCKIIYRPGDGKKFMTDVLEMRGELFLGIGRSQYWQKSTLEEASSLR